MEEWIHIGDISVDAGLCWVGDPCYVLGDDASSRVKDWISFCDALNVQQDMDGRNHNEDGFSEPLGSGVGFALQTGYGDGSYPVEILRSGGRVSGIRILFINDEVEEEEEADSGPVW